MHRIDPRLWRVLAVVCLLAAVAGCTPVPDATPAPPTATVAPTAIPAPSATAMAARWTPGQLEIHLLEVEHGDAQLIVSPTGETMLVDCARLEFAGKVAQYLREVLGEATVDYLVLSHYHTDHLGAFVPLLRDEGLKVRKAILDRGGGRDELDEARYRDYFDYVTDPAHNLKRVRLRTGDTIDMGPKMTVRVLAVGDVDARTSAGVPVVGENDNSVVLWLTFGRFDYYTGGDLSGVDSLRYANVEKAVIPLLPRHADAAKANHHAVEYNNNPEFMAALSPQALLISGNTGLIKLATLKRLDEHSDVYITEPIPGREAHGDIVLTSKDGDTFVVEGKTYTSK